MSEIQAERFTWHGKPAWRCPLCPYCTLDEGKMDGHLLTHKQVEVEVSAKKAFKRRPSAVPTPFVPRRKRKRIKRKETERGKTSIDTATDRSGSLPDAAGNC